MPYEHHVHMLNTIIDNLDLTLLQLNAGSLPDTSGQIPRQIFLAGEQQAKEARIPACASAAVANGVTWYAVLLIFFVKERLLFSMSGCQALGSSSQL